MVVDLRIGVFCWVVYMCGEWCLCDIVVGIEELAMRGKVAVVNVDAYFDE